MYETLSLAPSQQSRRISNKSFHLCKWNQVFDHGMLVANLPSDDKRKEKLKVEVIPTYVNKKGISGKVINNQLAKIKAHFSEYELIGTHAGRRTFICFALSSGIPPQVVMKWTGHSDYQAMKPYIDIAEKTKVNAMQLFEEEMSK